MKYGYWYYRGKLYDVTSDRHVNMIIDNPEMFGMTKEDVKAVFLKYGEQLRVEGKAREELIIQAIHNGWIRLRHYTKPQDYWSIQYDDFRKQRRALKDLIELLVLDKGIMRNDEEVVFLGFGDKSQYNYSFMNGGISKFLMENNKKKLKVKMLDESSLSRIIQHIQNPNSTFGIVSAFSSNRSLKRNLEVHEQLRDDIKEMNYHSIEQESGYTYKDNNEQEQMVEEKSFFIPNISKEDILYLGEKYTQESIIYKDKNVFELVSTKDESFGETILNFSKEKNFTFNKDAIKIAYSALIKSHHNQRGVKFSYLEEIQIPSQTDNIISALIEKKGLAHTKRISLI